MAQKQKKLNFFQRLMGRPLTQLPANNDFWSYENGQITLELSKAPDLSTPSGAVRLEGKGLPKNILVVFGEDQQYHAFQNKCTHGGRCLDPIPGTQTVQCCSLGKSTFDYSGKLISGSAQTDIEVLDVQRENGELRILV